MVFRFDCMLSGLTVALPSSLYRGRHSIQDASAVVQSISAALRSAVRGMVWWKLGFLQVVPSAGYLAFLVGILPCCGGTPAR